MCVLAFTLILTTLGDDGVRGPEVCDICSRALKKSCRIMTPEIISRRQSEPRWTERGCAAFYFDTSFLYDADSRWRWRWRISQLTVLYFRRYYNISYNSDDDVIGECPTLAGNSVRTKVLWIRTKNSFNVFVKIKALKIVSTWSREGGKTSMSCFTYREKRYGDAFAFSTMNSTAVFVLSEIGRTDGSWDLWERPNLGQGPRDPRAG